MEFDRKGPGGGLEIYTFIENGKALMEFKVYLRKLESEEMLEEVAGEDANRCKESCLDICMWDREGRLVFGAHHPVCSEELAKGLILHPHLWQGVEDPYLYRVRVSLLEKHEHAIDVIETLFAFRTFRELPGKGWFLNDKAFPVRAVAYVIPSPVFFATILDRNARSARIRQDLEMIRGMGANTICPIGGDMAEDFCRICDEMGLLVWMTKGKIPRFYGSSDSLLTFHGRVPTDRYFYYKACWSKEPFVYICMNTLRRQDNGNAKLTIYSNRKKVALYVDGVLFEFKSDGPEFIFEEIPVKKLPLMLAAEADECSMSVTVSAFTKLSQNNHFSMTFNTYNDLSKGEQA